VDKPGDSTFPNWPEFRRLFAYDDLVGKLVQGRYEVVRRLGAGGMGVVFLARHIHLDKHFALKIISPRFLDDPQIGQRFLQEARAASKIDHPNVVNITDFGPPEEGPAFFAMEHLEGEDLARLLAREGPLPWPRALPIASQIARALAAAHQRGVIHRDIKPQNCLRISRDDNPDFIKVLDFGLAKVLTATGKSAWTVGGSPGYIAPEIYRGGRTDHRVDIYALGALLHTLLLGRLPAQTPADVDLPPGAPVLHLADLPPPLRALLERAMHDDPERRHPDAESLLAALEATRTALADPPPAILAPVPPDISAHARRRWPLAAALALASLVALAAVTWPEPPADRTAALVTPKPAPTPAISPQPVPKDTPAISQQPVLKDTPAISPQPVPTDTPPIAPQPAPTDTPPIAPPDPATQPAPTPAPAPAPAPRKPPADVPRRPPPAFDPAPARALLQRQAAALAACKADSSFRAVTTIVRLTGEVQIDPRGRATVTLPPGYDVNACIERLVAGLRFRVSLTGGSFSHTFLL
jgi:serine/threonine protein kinase